MKVSSVDAKIRDLVLQRQKVKMKVADISAKIKDLQTFRRSILAVALRKKRAKETSKTKGRGAVFDVQLCMRCVYKSVGKDGASHYKRLCKTTAAWLRKPGNMKKVRAHYKR